MLIIFLFSLRVLIGAPRQNYSGIIKPGAVYRCPVSTSSTTTPACLMLPIRAARRWSIHCMLMSFSGDGSKFKAGGGGLDDQKSKQAKKKSSYRFRRYAIGFRRSGVDRKLLTSEYEITGI